MLGNLTEANSYLWKSNPDRLIPINKIPNIRLDLLIGIAGAKKKILKNTKQFAKGYPANNVLLWGSRGTGKSSLVKSAHQVVASEFRMLKLVEIQREDIGSLDRLLVVLNNIEIDNRYIIFCDDLSFDKNEKDQAKDAISLDNSLYQDESIKSVQYSKYESESHASAHKNSERSKELFRQISVNCKF